MHSLIVHRTEPVERTSNDDDDNCHIIFLLPSLEWMKATSSDSQVVITLLATYYLRLTVVEYMEQERVFFHHRNLLTRSAR